MTKKTGRSTIELTYDAEADALGLWLAHAGNDVRTRELAPGVHADFDRENRLVGVEVLWASKHYPREALERLANPVEYLTLQEAAAESGLAASTLRNQLKAGRLAGVKRGRDWLIAGHELLNYLENRAPSGRPGRVARAAQLQAKAAPGRRSKVG